MHLECPRDDRGWTSWRAQDQAGRVPELVAEPAVALDTALVEPDVLAGHRDRRGPRADGVRAVAIDQLTRVDPRTKRLRHAAAIVGLDLAVDRHVEERNLAHEFEAGHDHAADPEIDDLASRAVHARGIEGLQVVSLFGPTERREGPQRGRKPRVEHVGVLRQLDAPALGTLARWLDRNGRMAVVAVVDRDAMPEPELPPDVPVAQPSQPVKVRALVSLGVPPHLSGG